jgi:hypothetical protein
MRKHFSRCVLSYVGDIMAAINSVAKSVRRAARLIFVTIAATFISMSVQGQSPDHSLSVYAVKVVKTTPFEKPFTGYGIYLGKGAVITAAHVIGRWGFLKDLHVLIAGQSLPAKIIKEGSIEQDLTLLSIDEVQLPVSLRLRRNPLCKQPPTVGENVIVVAPEKITHSEIISPLLVAPEFRMRFDTLIADLVGASGSGVFDAEKRCLMGIISRRVQKYEYRKEDGKIVAAPVGFAGYFVPASQIADFIPPEFRF